MDAFDDREDFPSSSQVTVSTEIDLDAPATPPTPGKHIHRINTVGLQETVMIVPDPVAEWKKQQPPWPRTREELVPPMIVSQIEKWDWRKELLPSVQDILDLVHSETAAAADSAERMDVDEKPLLTDKTNNCSYGTEDMVEERGQGDLAEEPSGSTSKVETAIASP